MRGLGEWLIVDEYQIRRAISGQYVALNVVISILTMVGVCMSLLELVETRWKLFHETCLILAMTRTLQETLARTKLVGTTMTDPLNLARNDSCCLHFQAGIAAWYDGLGGFGLTVLKPPTILPHSLFFLKIQNMGLTDSSNVQAKSLLVKYAKISLKTHETNIRLESEANFFPAPFSYTI